MAHKYSREVTLVDESALQCNFPNTYVLHLQQSHGQLYAAHREIAMGGHSERVSESARKVAN
jgi:hypothetical protein